MPGDLGDQCPWRHLPQRLEISSLDLEVLVSCWAQFAPPPGTPQPSPGCRREAGRVPPPSPPSETYGQRARGGRKPPGGADAGPSPDLITDTASWLHGVLAAGSLNHVRVYLFVSYKSNRTPFQKQKARNHPHALCRGSAGPSHRRGLLEGRPFPAWGCIPG